MKVKIAFLIFVCLLLMGCAKKASDVECLYDSDCQRAGCSGELCVDKDKAGESVTLCVYKSEYDCLKNTTCSCIDYKCKWAETNAYNQCMDGLAQS